MTGQQNLSPGKSVSPRQRRGKTPTRATPPREVTITVPELPSHVDPTS